jgi:hypothetical protein
VKVTLRVTVYRSVRLRVDDPNLVCVFNTVTVSLEVHTLMKGWFKDEVELLSYPKLHDYRKSMLSEGPQSFPFVCLVTVAFR